MKPRSCVSGGFQTFTISPALTKSAIVVAGVDGISATFLNLGVPASPSACFHTSGFDPSISPPPANGPAACLLPYRPDGAGGAIGSRIANARYHAVTSG